jgi:hypothetical protein
VLFWVESYFHHFPAKLLLQCTTLTTAFATTIAANFCGGIVHAPAKAASGRFHATIDQPRPSALSEGISPQTNLPSDTRYSLSPPKAALIGGFAPSPDSAPFQTCPRLPEF